MKKFVKFDMVTVEGTKDFGKNQENRAINHGHLQKIKVQCLTNLEMMPPITINSITNHVIDGQHRLKAFQSLVNDGSLPIDSMIKVMFVEIPVDEEKNAIVEANTNSKNWSLDDYIASYAKAGIVSYVKLEEWCESHILCYKFTKDKETGEQNKVYSYRYGAAILTGKRCSNELKSASFTFSEEDAEIANDVHAEMLEIIDLFGLKGNGAWIEALAVTWHEYRRMHPFKEWMKELKKKKSRFMKMPKENSKEWEAIFNTAHGAIDKNAC